MNRSSTSNSIRLVSLLGAGLLTASALAQQAGALQEVTVIAERPTSTIVGRAGATGAPIELIELRHRVSYADLNLATASGANALNKRVKDAAKAACDELDKLYPLKERDSKCADKAADAAKGQVDAAIAAAEKKSK